MPIASTLRVSPTFQSLLFIDELLEDAAALLVIFKLVEARAGRREQHHIAGLRGTQRLRSPRWPAFRRSGWETTPRSCDSILSAAEPMV